MIVLENEAGGLDGDLSHTCYFLKHYDDAKCNAYGKGCIALSKCLVGLSGPVHCDSAAAHLAAMQM